jgi:hypothetical protein
MSYKDTPILKGISTTTKVLCILGIISFIGIAFLFVPKEKKKKNKIVFSEYETQTGILRNVEFVEDKFAFTLYADSAKWIYNQLSYNAGEVPTTLIDKMDYSITVKVRFDYNKDSILVAKTLESVKGN